jgi:hypothetical protein
VDFDMVELVLGCKSWQQAQDITDHLLSMRLIVRAEALTAQEIKLLLTTTHHYVAAIEEEVKNLLSLDTVSLHSIPLSRFNHYTISGLEQPLGVVEQ